MILKKIKRMTATIINGIGILIDRLSSLLTDWLVDYINLPVLGLHGIVILLLQLFHKALAETWRLPTAPKVGTKGYQRQLKNVENWLRTGDVLIFPWSSLVFLIASSVQGPPPVAERPFLQVLLSGCYLLLLQFFFAMEKLGVTMGDRMKLLVKNVDNIILFNIKIAGFSKNRITPSPTLTVI